MIKVPSNASLLEIVAAMSKSPATHVAAVVSSAKIIFWVW